MTFHNLIFFEEYEILIVKCHKLQNLWQSIKQTMFYFENEMFHWSAITSYTKEKVLDNRNKILAVVW